MELFTIMPYFILLHAAAFSTTMMYDSTMSCLIGSEQDKFYKLSCSHDNTTEVGLIAIKHVYSGAKPEAAQCMSSDTAYKCCQYVHDQDCLLEAGEGDLPENVLSGCSGQRECIVEAKATVTYKCPLPVLFDTFTTYGYVDYQCINVGLLKDICHEGIMLHKSELFINSNVYHQNTEYSNKSCTCSVTTSCGAGIVVESVNTKLSRSVSTGTCIETLRFTDHKDAAHAAEYDCNDHKLNGFKNVFTSHSNHLDIDLTILGNHTGKLWLKVKSTWSNSTVELRCGGVVGVNADHLCPADFTTTSSTPTTTNIIGKSCFEEPEIDGCTVDDSAIIQDVQLTDAAIGGIIAAGIIILLVIMVVLVLIIKRKASHQENIYDHPSIEPPNYYSLPVPYNNNIPTKVSEENAYINPAYNVNEKNGHQFVETRDSYLTPAYDTIEKSEPPFVQNTNSMYMVPHPETENLENESIMVMPNGAVHSDTSGY